MEDSNGAQGHFHFLLPPRHSSFSSQTYKRSPCPHPVHNHLSRHPKGQSQLLRSPHPSISPMLHLQGVPVTPTERAERKSSPSPSLHRATLAPLGRQPPLQDKDKGKMWLWLLIPRLPGQMASTLGESQEDSLRGRLCKKQSLPKLRLGVKCSHCPLCLYPDMLSPGVAGLSQSQLIIDQVANKSTRDLLSNIH